MSGSTPGFFGRVAAAVMGRPGRTLGLLLGLCLLAAALATRLRVDPNLLRLLPADDPTAQAIERLNAEEGGAHLVTITVEGADPAALDAWMRTLEARLGQVEGVDYAVYSVPDEVALRLGLLQLSVDELSTIRERLQGAILLGPTAANPFVAARLLDLGPLTARLTEAQDRLPSLGGAGEGRARLLVRPSGSAFDASFAAPFLGRLQAAIAEVDVPDDGIEVTWVGGVYRHSVEDVQAIRADLGWTAGLSGALVLGLLALAFRDLRATLVLLLPLVLANLWTTGVASLAVGSLNTFTSFYPAVLVGLGVDFSIHLYSRYREERVQASTVQEAVIRAWDRAGPPCLTAAVTSAGGFCALWVAGFGGFRQLGTLLAVGVLLCLAAVVVMLPLLILWRDRKPTPVLGRQLAGADTDGPPPTYRLAPVALLLTFSIALAASMQLPKIDFEYDLSEMRSEGLAYQDLTEEGKEAAEASMSPIVASFPDDASLTEAHARVQQALDDGTAQHLRGALSWRSVVPVDQEARLAVVRDIATLAADPNVRFLPLPVQQNLARIAQADARPVAPADLPGPLQHLLGVRGGTHRLMLLPKGNQWDLRNNLALKTEIEALLPGVAPAGEYLALATLYTMVRHDVPRVAGVALVIVFLLTWLDLRSARRAASAVVALGVGMAWAGAGMVAFDVRLSLVNFVGVPILMGIGVDVIIHLLHRMDEEGPGRVRRALATTGWATGLSSATTVLSFAALSVATHQGVRSLGHIIVLGLTLVTLAGFVAVPLGWMTVWKLRGRLPPAGGPGAA
jgi:predicted RND superfamily exporter protein